MNNTIVKIDRTRLDTFTRRQRAKVVEAEMNKVINSQYFKRILIDLLETSPYALAERSKWKDATPLEIYMHIMRAAEVLSPEVDHIIDIEVDDYYSFKRVIGYTKRNIKTIFTNSKYYDVRSTKLIGSNFIHEYGHKLGFGHDFRSTNMRPFSLCYLLNIAYEETYNFVYEVPSDVPDIQYYCYRPWYYLGFVRKCREL